VCKTGKYDTEWVPVVKTEIENWRVVGGGGYYNERQMKFVRRKFQASGDASLQKQTRERERRNVKCEVRLHEMEENDKPFCACLFLWCLNY
jgi:hypothetical protein